jgi:hypothetical protein
MPARALQFFSQEETEGFGRPQTLAACGGEAFTHRVTRRARDQGRLVFAASARRLFMPDPFISHRPPGRGV